MRRPARRAHTREPGQGRRSREAIRSKAEPPNADDAPLDSLRKKLDVLVAGAALAGKTGRRLELIDLLDEGRESIERLTQELRKKTLMLI